MEVWGGLGGFGVVWGVSMDPRARFVPRDFGPSIYLLYWHRSVLVIMPRSANFEVWIINNKLFVVFGRNERAFISSVVWVVTALGGIFQSGNSKGEKLILQDITIFLGAYF